jgi:FtsZ-interacting cell division protein ZipA
MIGGILIAAMAAGSPVFAQANSDDVAQLKQRVERLEQQVREMARLLEPIKAQQAADNRRNALRKKFEKKAAEDQANHTPEQLREAEGLYQVANQKWGSPEATESLQKMIRQYPDLNRTGCAVLYLAQSSKDDVRANYLHDCIEKYNGCFYGDGVQVGAYARFLLAQDYRSKGDPAKAEALEKELKTQYADAVDHGGKLLVDSPKAESE